MASRKIFSALSKLPRNLVSSSGPSVSGKYAQPIGTRNLPARYMSSAAAWEGQDDVVVQRGRKGGSPGYSRRLETGDVSPFHMFQDLWNPFLSTRSLRQMMDTVDRVFDDSIFFTSPEETKGHVRTPWDVKETEDVFHLRVDMPGFGKEEVKVYVEDRELVIKGERKSEEGDAENWSARSYGSYNTRLVLPENVSVEQIKAEMKHGVLRVTLCKMKEQPRSSIDINVD